MSSIGIFVITHIPSRSRTSCLNWSVRRVLAMDKARKYGHSSVSVILPVLPSSNCVNAWKSVTYLLTKYRSFEGQQQRRMELEGLLCLYVRRCMGVRNEAGPGASGEGLFDWRKGSGLAHQCHAHQREKKHSDSVF